MRASSRSTTARTCLCSNRIKLASTDHCRAKTLLPHKKSISSSQSALDQIHILIICQSLTLPISIRAAWALLAAPASPVDGTPSRDILLASFVKVPDIPSGRMREGATGSCRPCEQNQTGETWGYEQVDSAAGSCRHCGVCRHRECGSPELTGHEVMLYHEGIGDLGATVASWPPALPTYQQPAPSHLSIYTPPQCPRSAPFRALPTQSQQ